MAKHLIITGRVQGVGYRDALRHEANAHGVSGWVRNRADGSVEALLDGPAEAVDALVVWARSGPPMARVVSVRAIDTNEHAQASGGFERRPTA